MFLLAVPVMALLLALGPVLLPEFHDPLTAGLLDAARGAFTQGLQLTAITSAAIVVGMAVLALLLLRPASLSSDAEGPAGSAPPDRSSPGPTAEKS